MTTDHERYADPGYRYNSWAGNPKGTPQDPDRCRWSVTRYIGNWPHSGQCQRKAKVDDLWCKQHSPEAMKSREDAYWKKANYESAKWRYDFDIKKFSTKAIEALREIAKGELNDPAGYAAIILEDEPKKPEKP